MTLSIFDRRWLCIALLLTLGACSDAEPDVADGEEFARDVRILAKKIQKSIGEGNPDVFEEAMNINALLDRVLDNLSLSASEKRAFGSGVKGDFALGRDLCEQVKEGGSIRLIRAEGKSGKGHALFRVIDHTGGLNYHDLIIEPDKSGDLRINDIYVYSTGELLSRTLRRHLLTVLSTVKSGDPSLSDVDMELAQQSIRLTDLVKQEEYDEALEMFDALPEQLQREKIMLLMQLQCAAEIDTARYLRVMSTFERLYPGDPALLLQQIDKFYLQGEYDLALRNIARLDSVVRGDPYLDFLRANMNVAKNDLEAAKSLARKAIRNEPTLEQPYWTLIHIHMGEEDYAQVSKVIGSLVNRLSKDRDSLLIANYSTLESFMTSPEYRAWKDKPSSDTSSTETD